MNNSGITILNVDSGEAGLCVKSRILREAGYRVIEARTGADALRLTLSESPQLVLLSVNLPDQSGLEVCRRIKTDPAPSSNSSSNMASTLVLLVSATFVGCERRARSLEEGADGYLLEPVTPEFLLANIKTLLRRPAGDADSERLLAGERRQAWALKKLAEAALAINSAGSLDEIPQLVTDHARELIGAHQAATSLTSDFPDTNAPGVNGGWLNAVSLSEKYDQTLIGYSDGRVGAWVGSLVCRLNQPMRLTQADLESQRAWRDQTDARPDQAPGLAVLEGVATLREQATLRELAALVGVAAFGRVTTPREMAALRMMETLRDPQILRGLEMRGWLAAPLTSRDGRNLGLIQLSDKYDGEFVEQDEAILAQLAQMVSVAVENFQLYHREQKWRVAAENAARAKDEFLAMISHRLRTPLNAILGWAWVLRRQTGGARDVARAAEIIERNARAQAQLVEDLLEASRVIAGKLPVNAVCARREEETERWRDGETERWREEETEERRDGETGSLSVPPSLRPSVPYSPDSASRGAAASGGC